MGNGRMEARYTLTSAWTGTCTNSVGATPTWTVAAGNYYASALAAALQAALRAVTSAFATWTVTIDSVENGTGRVTIHKGAAGTWTVTFVSTDFRDALGFTGNLTAVSSAQTGPNAMQGLWLPDCPIKVPSPGLAGFTRSDKRSSVSPTGAVYSAVGTRRIELDRCTWSLIGKARAIDSSAYPMSWRQFVLDTQLGTRGHFPAGARVAIFTDATLSTLLGYYHLPELNSNELVPAVDGWDGRWRLDLTGLMNQAA